MNAREVTILRNLPPFPQGQTHESNSGQGAGGCGGGGGMAYVALSPQTPGYHQRPQANENTHIQLSISYKDYHAATYHKGEHPPPPPLSSLGTTPTPTPRQLLTTPSTCEDPTLLTQQGPTSWRRRGRQGQRQLQQPQQRASSHQRRRVQRLQQRRVHPVGEATDKGSHRTDTRLQQLRRGRGQRGEVGAAAVH
jgi:hypothetical protein